MQFVDTENPRLWKSRRFGGDRAERGARPNEIKAFFAAKLAQQKNDLVEKIRGMKKEPLEGMHQNDVLIGFAHNQAIEQVLRTLDV